MHIRFTGEVSIEITRINQNVMGGCRGRDQNVMGGCRSRDQNVMGGCRSRDRMVVGFTLIYVISDYHL
jgi:hypothetical protein